MMNLTNAAAGDDDVVAVFSDDEWTFNVVLDTGAGKTKNMEIISFDEDLVVDMNIPKTGTIVISERYLQDEYEKMFGIDECPSSREIYAEDQNYPGEKLMLENAEKKAVILWNALGVAMSFAEEWAASKWIETQATEQ
jgi:hypothetical protein